MNTYFRSEEKQVGESFENLGYYIFPLAGAQSEREETGGIGGIRSFVHQECQNWCGKELPSIDEFLDQTPKYIDLEELNALRVHLIQKLNEDPKTSPLLFQLARKPLEWLVGNEIAMQKACNLSIQYPGDTSSLLPLHSDVWSGNSPFEVVFWLPLTPCYRTRSMFLLPRRKTQEVYEQFPKFAKMDSEELFEAIRSDLTWLEVPLGHGVLFSHTLLHGNRVNEEAATRWSINIRFKSVLSPYGSKELGETFRPVTLRPATRVGLEYQHPSLS